MTAMFQIDWQSMFVPTASLLEVVMRGSIMYLAMFVLLRVFRRQTGTLGIADLLVIVVIADAAQNGMAGDTHSVTEAVLLVSTIVFWDWIFDWVGFRSTLVERVLQPDKLLLIKNGRMLRRNMKRELITEEELMSQLRQQGIDDINLVESCYLEGNGHFSVIKKSGDNDQASNESGNPTVN